MKALIFLLPLLALSEQVFVSQQTQDDAAKIIQFLTQGKGKGQAYDWLETLADTFGNRYAPGPQYDKAAAYVVSKLKELGVDKVWMEQAPGVPHWFRGQPPNNSDYAMLLEPRPLYIPVLALGNSTATPKGGLKNVKAIVVRSFDELAALPDDKVQGRIVVWNQPWLGSYDKSVQYRAYGATKAAERGAIATLIRSVTPQSLYTLHTGGIHYSNDSKLQIPVGSITVEDAELLYRLQEKYGNELVMSLEMNTQFFGYISKPNVVAEITGSMYPDEMVLFGGHLDSWDVGQGAMDDGGGITMAWQALATVKQLGLRPKRTLRAVFWAAEEFGYIGSAAFYKNHSSDSSKISLVMESDTGTFNPLGFHYQGNAKAHAMLTEVMQLLKPLNATALPNDGQGPGDPGPFVTNNGVPGVELMTEGFNDKYFWYHHTNADTMTMTNSTHLDKCAAVWTVMAYSVANFDQLLPHGK